MADLVTIQANGAMGISAHTGVTMIADGTEEAALRLEACLTTDAGIGVVRHAQAGYETGILNLFSALSGSDVIIECTSASLENTTASVPEQAVIGNEICSFINRILQGIEVNPDTLAVDVIREIGPGGEYLTHDHTMEHFKSEQWDSALGNRMTRDHWEEEGAKDIRARAREQYKKIRKENPELLGLLSDGDVMLGRRHGDRRAEFQPR